ncbi:hypothetical protein H696_00947 [Fonticula alba]|uniref:Uncharacterized protein n=1 Tax=Fonticula alba TaxID=691883 RepID=A0A058ZG84_FONAL|nr:hypothetical protein H696_00947 [Fonticula alba]KCV73410.1 hypothetical protein H696_00947 [Fonticula alba]|eukprot:XP_009493111.1 hypothetical protein H696_00947 [Fonticula alba]
MESPTLSSLGRSISRAPRREHLPPRTTANTTTTTATTTTATATATATAAAIAPSDGVVDLTMDSTPAVAAPINQTLETQRLAALTRATITFGDPINLSAAIETIEGRPPPGPGPASSSGRQAPGVTLADACRLLVDGRLSSLSLLNALQFWQCCAQLGRMPGQADIPPLGLPHPADPVDGMPLGSLLALIGLPHGVFIEAMRLVEESPVYGLFAGRRYSPALPAAALQFPALLSDDGVLLIPDMLSPLFGLNQSSAAGLAAVPLDDGVLLIPDMLSPLFGLNQSSAAGLAAVPLSATLTPGQLPAAYAATATPIDSVGNIRHADALDMAESKSAIFGAAEPPAPGFRLEIAPIREDDAPSAIFGAAEPPAPGFRLEIAPIREDDAPVEDAAGQVDPLAESQSPDGPNQRLKALQGRLQQVIAHGVPDRTALRNIQHALLQQIRQERANQPPRRLAGLYSEPLGRLADARFLHLRHGIARTRAQIRQSQTLPEAKSRLCVGGSSYIWDMHAYAGYLSHWGWRASSRGGSSIESSTDTSAGLASGPPGGDPARVIPFGPQRGEVVDFRFPGRRALRRGTRNGVPGQRGWTSHQRLLMRGHAFRLRRALGLPPQCRRPLDPGPLPKPLVAAGVEGVGLSADRRRFSDWTAQSVIDWDELGRLAAQTGRTPVELALYGRTVAAVSGRISRVGGAAERALFNWGDVAPGPTGEGAVSPVPTCRMCCRACGTGGPDDALPLDASRHCHWPNAEDMPTARYSLGRFIPADLPRCTSCGSQLLSPMPGPGRVDPSPWLSPVALAKHDGSDTGSTGASDADVDSGDSSDSDLSDLEGHGSLLEGALRRGPGRSADPTAHISLHDSSSSDSDSLSSGSSSSSSLPSDESLPQLPASDSEVSGLDSDDPDRHLAGKPEAPPHGVLPALPAPGGPPVPGTGKSELPIATEADLENAGTRATVERRYLPPPTSRRRPAAKSPRRVPLFTAGLPEEILSRDYPISQAEEFARMWGVPAVSPHDPRRLAVYDIGPHADLAPRWPGPSMLFGDQATSGWDFLRQLYDAFHEVVSNPAAPISVLRLLRTLGRSVVPLVYHALPNPDSAAWFLQLETRQLRFTRPEYIWSGLGAGAVSLCDLTDEQQGHLAPLVFGTHPTGADRLLQAASFTFPRRVGSTVSRPGRWFLPGGFPGSGRLHPAPQHLSPWLGRTEAVFSRRSPLDTRRLMSLEFESLECRARSDGLTRPDRPDSDSDADPGRELSRLPARLRHRAQALTGAYAPSDSDPYDSDHDSDPGDSQVAIHTGMPLVLFFQNLRDGLLKQAPLPDPGPDPPVPSGPGSHRLPPGEIDPVGVEAELSFRRDLLRRTAMLQPMRLTDDPRQYLEEDRAMLAQRRAENRARRADAFAWARLRAAKAAGQPTPRGAHPPDALIRHDRCVHIARRLYLQHPDAWITTRAVNQLALAARMFARRVARVAAHLAVASAHRLAAPRLASPHWRRRALRNSAQVDATHVAEALRMVAQARPREVLSKPSRLMAIWSADPQWLLFDPEPAQPDFMERIFGGEPGHFDDPMLGPPRPRLHHAATRLPGLYKSPDHVLDVPSDEEEAADGAAASPAATAAAGAAPEPVAMSPIPLSSSSSGADSALERYFNMQLSAAGSSSCSEDGRMGPGKRPRDGVLEHAAPVTKRLATGRGSLTPATLRDLLDDVPLSTGPSSSEEEPEEVIDGALLHPSQGDSQSQPLFSHPDPRLSSPLLSLDAGTLASGSDSDTLAGAFFDPMERAELDLRSGLPSGHGVLPVAGVGVGHSSSDTGDSSGSGSSNGSNGSGSSDSSSDGSSDGSSDSDGPSDIDTAAGGESGRQTRAIQVAISQARRAAGRADQLGRIFGHQPED